MSIIRIDSGHPESHCAVCGSHDLFRDEVEADVFLALIECRRCGYQLTSSERTSALEGVRAGVGPEEEGRVVAPDVANAA